MFHAHCGKYAKLTNDRKTAHHTGGFFDGASGVVLSAEALTPGQPFAIKVEETFKGGKCILALGVTQRDPDTRPQLPEWPREMKRVCVVEGSFLYRDGEKEGFWSGDLKGYPGDTASLVWDGADIYITDKGAQTLAFTGVTGPLWAVTDVWHGIPELSIIPPEPKAVATKKEAPVKKRSAVSPVTRTEPAKPTTRGGYLTGAMDKMALGGTREQSMGAIGSLIPKRTSSVTCAYWRVCGRFLDSLQLPDVYYDSQHDQCYCINCILSRGDNLYYTRGEPPKSYGLPLGWCRFGLGVPRQAHGMGAFQKWHVAFHGTIPNNIQPIIESQSLLMPGDYTIEGKLLAPPKGHFTEKRKPEGFDVKQVFVSPTITYAGHAAYARPHSWTDPQTGKVHDIQVAIQVRIKPDSYTVGRETLGFGSETIDSKFNNNELEWSTKIRGATIMQGILVKPFYIGGSN